MFAWRFITISPSLKVCLNVTLLCLFFFNLQFIHSNTPVAVSCYSFCYKYMNFPNLLSSFCMLYICIFLITIKSDFLLYISSKKSKLFKCSFHAIVWNRIVFSSDGIVLHSLPWKKTYRIEVCNIIFFVSNQNPWCHSLFLHTAIPILFYASSAVSHTLLCYYITQTSQN